MLSRSAKTIYYLLAGPAMKANGFFYRSFRAPRSGFQRVHLGPGQKKYIAGWINVDANMFTAHCDVWADLRDPLPFRDNSIDAVYSHHVVEHLPDIPRHIAEVFRCLKPGGAYRVGAPNGDSAIQKFLQGDSTWFGDWPEKRRSAGGRLNNFILCKNEHLAIVTQSYLRELLEDAGFREIRACLVARESERPDLFDPCLSYEAENTFECPHTLILEATK